MNIKKTLITLSLVGIAALALSQGTLPRPRKDASNWENLGHGIYLSWFVVSKSEQICSWDVHNSNSERVSGIVEVEGETKDGKRKWCGTFEGTLGGGIQPGKSLGGWSTFTVTGIRVTQARIVELKIGSRVVVKRS